MVASVERASLPACVDCATPIVGKIRRGRCENCYRGHLRELKQAGSFTPSSRPGQYVPGQIRATGHPGAIALESVQFMSDDCWRYTGHVNPDGYGILDVSRKLPQMRAHRAVWEFLIGPIPDGLELDHLCHGRDPHCPGSRKCLHRRCVNPGHLEPVPAVVNTMRGLGPTAVNARKTHCNRGHEFTPTNTYWQAPKKPHLKPTRRCRTCMENRRASRRADG